MIDDFSLKLLISFLSGAIWITSLTVISEKFGTKIGGVVSGIPSITFISLFFIGWTQSAQSASDASVIIPIILGIDGLVILIYLFIAKYNFYLSMLVSLIAWVVFSQILIYIKFDSLAISLGMFLALLIFVFWITESKLKIESAGPRSNKKTFYQLLIRSVIGGAFISASTLGAKIGGPQLGGALSSFPAITYSMILINYYTHGTGYTRSLVKTVMISGLVNCAIYSMAVYISYPLIGIYYGTLLSMLISLISSYFTYLFVNKKML